MASFIKVSSNEHVSMCMTLALLPYVVVGIPYNHFYCLIVLYFAVVSVFGKYIGPQGTAGRHQSNSFDLVGIPRNAGSSFRNFRVISLRYEEMPHENHLRTSKS